MKLIAGSRGSRLAMVQTRSVIDKIKKIYPDIDIEIKVIKTKGDRVLDKALDKIGDKGLFVSEIESQLMDGQVDFAVHSLKDMPSELMAGLKLTPCPVRVDSRDVVIVNPKHKVDTDIIFWLSQNNKLQIGTSSKRRSAQLKLINPNIEVKAIRGNIDTRINKLVDENLDAIVLAAAALERLNIGGDNVHYLDKEKFIPAPAQGALGIEIRKNDKNLEEIFSSISHERSNFEVEAERSFLNAINGSCHIPVGAVSLWRENCIEIKGIYGNQNMNRIEKDSVILEFDSENNTGDSICKNLEIAKNMGVELAERLVKKF